MSNIKKQILESSLVENCVKRSREIIYLKAAKLSLREAQLLLNGVNKVFPDSDSLKDLLQSIDVLIEDHKLSIARSLKPILQHHGINIKEEEGFWFTNDEMQKGYLLLGDKILFLGTGYDGPFKIEMGEIHTIDNNISIALSSIKPISGYDSDKLKYAISKLRKYDKYKRQIKKRNDNT